MLKTLLAATTALTLMSGVGFAESSYSSSTTQSTTQIAPPTHDVDVTETTTKTSNNRGTLVEKDERGSDVSTPGGGVVSHSVTESTTTR